MAIFLLLPRATSDVLSCFFAFLLEIVHKSCLLSEMLKLFYCVVSRETTLVENSFLLQNSHNSHDIKVIIPRT